MLSYPIPEAEELLANKLSAAQQSLSNCEEDMDFLREQVTVRYILPFLLTHISTTSLLSAMFIAFPSRLNATSELTCLSFTDYGSRHSSRLQLGYRTEAEGGSRGGMKEQSNESVTNPVFRSSHEAMTRVS
jgi:hypothetical protein